jgi:hypothetical protein
MTVPLWNALYRHMAGASHVLQLDARDDAFARDCASALECVSVEGWWHSAHRAAAVVPPSAADPVQMHAVGAWQLREHVPDSFCWVVCLGSLGSVQQALVGEVVAAMWRSCSVGIALLANDDACRHVFRGKRWMHQQVQAAVGTSGSIRWQRTSLRWLCVACRHQVAPMADESLAYAEEVADAS